MRLVTLGTLEALNLKRLKPLRKAQNPRKLLVLSDEAKDLGGASQPKVILAAIKEIKPDEMSQI